jgi:hypothetical protein
MSILRKVNKDFFKHWSCDMAYVLGFFAADGNMIKTKRGTHFMAIQVTDKEIVYAIREAMHSDHKVSVRKGSGSISDKYRIQIGSREMFDDLVRLGFMPNKSKRLHMPTMPSEFFSDFVRGYFDGDGNVWVGLKHKERSKPLLCISLVFTSGTKMFLLELKEKLGELLSTGGSLVKKSGSNCYSLQYSIHDTLKLCDFMYHDRMGSSKLFLARKRKVFEKYKNLRP